MLAKRKKAGRFQYRDIKSFSDFARAVDRLERYESREILEKAVGFSNDPSWFAERVPGANVYRSVEEKSDGVYRYRTYEGPDRTLQPWCRIESVHPDKLIPLDILLAKIKDDPKVAKIWDKLNRNDSYQRLSSSSYNSYFLQAVIRATIK
jgi:hypothetical protein